MSRYTYPIILFLILTFSLSMCGNTTEENPPNVVFILVDDLGWKDLGSYGSTFYESPNIDSLATEGVRFTNAYSASSVCSPTRAAIMTGKHPARLNMTDWIPGMPTKRAEDPQLIPPEDIHNLPLDEVTMAEAFKNEGYKTFFAGKWHLGEAASHWPEHHGFDVNKGGHEKGSPPGGYYSPYENPRLEDGPKGEYLTNRLASESIKFIKSQKEDPFFLFLSFYTVHTPIQGCMRYDEYFQEKKKELPYQGKVASRTEHNGKTRLNQSNAEYAAMVKCMDENVGRIMDSLKKLNLYDNSIIILTSDNGGLTTTRTTGPTAVTPLRAGKGWLYEGGIRVPLVIKAPGMQNGKVSAQPVTSMDFYPTLLELAGLPSQNQKHVDGKSLLPYLEDPGKVDDRRLVWHYPHYHGSTWRPGSAIRINNWKLVEFYENEKLELYNLDEDLEEQHDLADSRPKVAKELHRKLIQWRDSMNAQIPKHRTPFRSRN